MRLLLDLGNTRLKWVLQGTSSEWLARGALPWQENLAATLALAWGALPPPAMVLAASVVDRARESQVAALTQQVFGQVPHWLRTPAHACGVRNAYAQPQRLGVDRFLTMVAAHATHASPCVLASAGTALTLDALTVDGRHLGGLIAPGARLMQQSLLDATVLVRPQRTGEIVQLADNTADAVSSGCWQAAAALIERFAAHVHARLGVAPTLILDGGDAPTLVPLLSPPVQLGRDGVLRGLALWADAHVTLPPSIENAGSGHVDEGSMFLRLLFVLLSALNIAVGAWLWLGQPYPRRGSPTDPGVPELRLLSEMPASGGTSLDVAARGNPVGNSGHGVSCMTLGPFATPQDLRRARQALASQVARMRSRQEAASQANGWWVYLAPASSRAAALEEARQLAAHDIDDYFVVGSGDQSNTISLGLFRDPANARKRLDQVIAAGFPARMTERSESVPEYWLDLVVADGGDFDWRRRIDTSGIGEHSAGCF